MRLFYQRLDLLDNFWVKWINRGDRTTNYVELFDGTKLNLSPNSNFIVLPYGDKSSPSVSDIFEDFSVFHTSVPNIKLYYPEPFIASPNFAHEDIWFLHIVIYQYWLWFFFIYLIIFFFLAFLITVRWCNVRHRPVRETRGVSRSKCGDLITATVPVSWAASIIIHESTDAIELADGFGSTEMAIGIRAYQWGWEYYYPKDLDLYAKKGSAPLRLGNSLNYQRSTNSFANKHSFKSLMSASDYLDISKTPASVLLGVTSDSNNAQNINFGANRLISRKASSNITSPRILNINNILHNPTAYSNNSQGVISNYVNYAYEDTYQSKPVYQTSQMLTLSPLSLFRCSANFSNLNDVVVLLSGGDASDTSNMLKVTGSNYQLPASNQSSSKLEVTDANSAEFNSNLALVLTKGDAPAHLDGNVDVWARSVSPWTSKLVNHYNAWTSLNNSSWPTFALIADQDFKRWASHELLEDLFWNTQVSHLDMESRQNFRDSSGSNFQMTDLAYENNTEILDYFVDTFSSSMSFSNLLSSYITAQQSSIMKNWSVEALDTSFSLLKLHVNSVRNASSSNVLLQSLTQPRNLSIAEVLNSYSMFQLNVSTLDSLGLNELSLINSSLDAGVVSKYSSASTPFFAFDKVNDSLSVAKSLNMFNQAFWKVFKSTLDEERSGFNYSQFSQTSGALPLIKTPLFSMLGLLQKTGDDFVQTHTWQLAPNLNLDTMPLDKVWEVFTLDFPFNLSFESDIMRYIWFDWYATKSTVITKAIDTSVFSLYGAKQYSYTFTKDPKVSLLNKTDNFFVKYSHARRLFIPSYIYTPFFYSKFRDWSLNSNLVTLFNLSSVSVDDYMTLLDISSLEQRRSVYKTVYHPFTANYSNTASPTKAYFTSANTTLNQIDSLTMLFDVLSKRDFLVRYFGLNSTHNPLVNSPLYSPSYTNPIVLQLKLASNYSHSNKYSLNFTNSLKTRRYFYDDYSSLNSYKNAILEQDDVATLRSPYQPMRKGIVNMIRIQADKAVAMPTDTRLQILAVSKDIIHSWSIPSAGIKIDCIPGYSSHRVALFTLSGIYWGQCMEICGRFHHWMPIVVYFIRRDLFCVWCVHFVFKNKQLNSVLQSFDQSFYDSSPAVSLDWSSWNYEL